MRKFNNSIRQVLFLKQKQREKKLSLKQQRKVIQLFHNLLISGFTLTEIVDFLGRSQLLKGYHIEQMRQGLLAGGNLSNIMANLGFSDNVVTQLSLADYHGDVQASMSKLEHYLANLLLVRKKIIEVATYPIILLLFLTLIMLGLKEYLLPQLAENSDNIAMTLLNNFPTIFLSLMLCLMVSVFLLCFYSRKIPKIMLVSKISHLPFIGLLTKYYLTAYYAREWGNLIGQGLELVQLVNIMQEQKSQLFREIGRDLEKRLVAGESFHQIVLSYPFFLTELSLMIEYGQVKSKLGTELTIYAEEIWERFFSKLYRATQLIQPLVFILVAVVIIMIYAAMLLPMYQNMEVNF
ncbi:competence type IV pilus assembly protein ComGB [Streptococcus sp. sy010]|uniref:competence type IV pilus assembly protein ComGB n=1 Tax=Streptococcus sp. sy010 TaxID=2600148 RepID=UPI0011B7C41F|nr:competence type IV pilus assembly protein ComGB [Streptococcus sp. sy010]TWT13391.1 type II secretion system F family protein [Streptococcus sp. sy010]